jgi:sphingomyelin phosphodiesterase acid-like 3
MSRSPLKTLFALFSVSLLAGSFALAQQAKVGPESPKKSAQRSAGTVPAILVSDIHFDPFHDPGKAKLLASSPTSGWKAILASPPSPDQQQAFDRLQAQCHAKGVDTPHELLQSALAAMKAQRPGARFMMVSGDLVVHNFSCRYHTLFPTASTEDYQAFVLKTVSYVVAELRGVFPGVPVYVALGNNDSGCGDYHFDPESDFLTEAGSILASGLPAAGRQAAAQEFAAGGNYSVTMAAPMKNTRLVVLNDTLFSPKYRTCSGERDGRGAAAEAVWLKEQLAQARQLGERVWVMGHIPPGIDPFSTIRQFKDICAGSDPVKFIPSDEIPDLMVEYADVVKLGIFAHTHMDEVRLLEHSGSAESAADKVGIKLVPSISPVHGNQPTFTVAQIDAASAGMVDYTVIAASNQSGFGTMWRPAYNFARTYHEPAFSVQTLDGLIGKFQADSIAALPESRSYLRNYYAGGLGAMLTPFWPQYVCGLNNYTVKDYAACICHMENRSSAP